MNTTLLQEQINEAALIESAKHFRLNGGHEDANFNKDQDDQGRINRGPDVERYIKSRLHALDRATSHNEVALFADRRTLTYIELGSGIREIVIIADGEPDPDYPNNTGITNPSHGGILASQRIEVVIDTKPGFATMQRLNATGEVTRIEGPAQLRIPLYTAVNFVEDASRIAADSLAPHALPYLNKSGELLAHGTLLTIGEPAVTAHHQAIADVIAQSQAA